MYFNLTDGTETEDFPKERDVYYIFYNSESCLLNFVSGGCSTFTITATKESLNVFAKASCKILDKFDSVEVDYHFKDNSINLDTKSGYLEFSKAPHNYLLCQFCTDIMYSNQLINKEHLSNFIKWLVKISKE